MNSAVQASLESFSARLDDAATALQLTLDEGQKSALLELVAQLVKWNRTYNLTALRDADQALVHHVFDSLAAVPPLMHWWAGQRGADLRILDVGSEPCFTHGNPGAERTKKRALERLN